MARDRVTPRRYGGVQDDWYPELGEAPIQRVEGGIVDRDAGDVGIEHDAAQVEIADGALRFRDCLGQALPGQAGEADEAVGKPLRRSGQSIVGSAGGGQAELGHQVLGAGHVDAENADVDAGGIHVTQLAVEAVTLVIEDELLGVAVVDDAAIGLDGGRGRLGAARQLQRVCGGKDVGLAVYAHRFRRLTSN